MSKLDKIIASFSGIVKDLESLHSKNIDKVNHNEDWIRHLNAQNHVLNDESARAARIAEKLRELTA